MLPAKAILTQENSRSDLEGSSIEKRNLFFFSSSTGQTINVDRVIAIYNQLKPLTLPFLDKESRQVQLWKVPGYGLIGSVLDQGGALKIIPGRNIRNPLNPNENPEHLLSRLDNFDLRGWKIIYDVRAVTLTLWPHLIAAGGETRDIRFRGSPIRYLSQEELIQKLKARGFVPTETDPNVWVNESRMKGNPAKDVGIAVHFDRPGEGNNLNEPLHIDLKFTPTKRLEIKNQRDAFKKAQLDNFNKRILNSTSKEERRQAETDLHNFKKQVKADETRHKNVHTKWRLVYGQKRPENPPSGPNKPGPGNPPGKGPGPKDFQQRLQQTKLTDSYNSSHSRNPVPPKGGTGGQIGGVACSTTYIKGLFDSPETLFEEEHYFCLPKLEGDKLPFTDTELRQILRELAIGIYTHSTVPFFSLHFNQNADLFPVIHPVYQNTLVGRVISMLDYIMKGYLNGGIFEEDFIDEWQKDPNWNKKGPSSFQKLINFEEYCSVKLKGADKHYQSLRGLMQSKGVLQQKDGLLKKALAAAKAIGIEVPDEAEREPEALSRFSGFTNSFRIIAKQNTIQKEGNVFVLDSDFDVLYTINPSPEYEDSLNLFLRKHGHLPPSYENMIQAYETMAKEIHDHMVKMPLCRDYFSMLAIINFFSGYFSTLKAHRKIPVLPALEINSVKGSPALFPHLPLNTAKTEHLQANKHKILKRILKDQGNSLKNYLSEGFDYLTSSKGNTSLIEFNLDKKKQLESLFEAAFKDDVLQHCSHLFKRYLELNYEKVSPHIQKAAAGFFQDILKTLEEAVQQVKTQRQGSRASLSVKKIGKHKSNILQRTIDAYLADPKLDEAENIFVFPEEYSTTRIKSEMSANQLEENIRVVGGCGMQLREQTVESSHKAAEILRNHHAKILDLKPESWEMLSNGEADTHKNAIFRLQLEEVPSWISDDYAWMESLLLVPKEEDGESIEKRLKIQEVMEAGDKEEFIKLVDQTPHLSRMKDRYQRSFLHHAALLSDLFYLDYLLKKGLPSKDADVHGYLPIHYAAVQGNMPHLKLLAIKDYKAFNARCRNGATPLLVAIQHDQLQAVQFLLSKTRVYDANTGGYNPLHCALHQGNLEVIDAVLSASALVSKCINEFAEVGGTPLMLACELDSAELVERLITLGADPKVKRKDGMSALEIAVHRGCKPVVERLLKLGVPTKRAFELASKEGSVEVVQLMTRAPWFYSYENSYKDTGLHTAIRHGNIQAALVIIENCIDVKYLSAVNLGEETPFSLAADLGSWGLIAALYEKRVAIDFHRLLRLEYQPLLEKFFSQKQLSTQELQQYLLTAAQVGNYQAITFILEPRGANLRKLKDSNGWRLLHYLAKFDGLYQFTRLMFQEKDLLQPLPKEGNKTLAYIAAEHRSSRVLNYLFEQMKQRKIPLEKHFHDRHLFYAIIESGDEKICQNALEIFHESQLANAPLDEQGTRGVHLAAKRGLESVLKLLSQKGADLNVQDKQGYTPLDYAARAGAMNIVSFLLEETHKVSVTARSLCLAAGRNEKLLKKLSQRASQEVLDDALLMAIDAHNAKAFAQLRKYHASLDAVSKQGWTPLLKASAIGSFEILREILKNRPLDMRTIDGNNALHLGSMQGHSECVRLLIQAGYVDEKNHKGLTAWDLSENRPNVQAALKNEKPSFDLVSLIKNGKVKKVETAISELPINTIIAIEDGLRTISGTPLQLLILLGLGKSMNSFIQSMLLKPDLDLNIRDSEGNTLAHLLLTMDVFPQELRHIDLSAKNYQGQGFLHIAAQYASSKTLQALLNVMKPLNVNEVDNQGVTPIFFAIGQNNEENVRLLIEKGADLRHYMHDLYTPLAAAFQKNNLTLIKLLLQKGADPNQLIQVEQITLLDKSIITKKDEITRCLLFHGANCGIISGTTDEQAIHYAAQAGNIPLLRLLDAKGLSLDITDRNGLRPIHHAAIHGQTEAVAAISSLDEWAIESPLNTEEDSDNPKASKRSMSGATTLHLAVRNGQMETAEYLLKQHANPEAKTESGFDVLSFAAMSPSKSLLSLFDPYKISQNPDLLSRAVMQAIIQDNLDVLVELYRRGAPINAVLENGYTGIQLACRSDALQCTQWLLTQGAEYRHPCPSGDTPLELSAANDSAEQLSLLLEYTESDVDQVNGRGKTLLHIAARAGKLKNVVLLLRQGASVNIADAGGYTALHLAAKEAHAPVVSLLLACGADTAAKTNSDRFPIDFVDVKDQNTKKAFKDFQSFTSNTYSRDESPLHLAVRCRNSLAVLLMSHTQDIDQQNSQGLTPLHLAAQTGQVEATMTLLRKRATIDIQDKIGRTPLWYAATQSNDPSLINLLTQAGADPTIKDSMDSSLIDYARKMGFSELLKHLTSFSPDQHVRSVVAEQKLVSVSKAEQKPSSSSFSKTEVKEKRKELALEDVFSLDSYREFHQAEVTRAQKELYKIPSTTGVLSKVTSRLFENAKNDEYYKHTFTRFGNLCGEVVKNIGQNTKSSTPITVEALNKSIDELLEFLSGLASGPSLFDKLDTQALLFFTAKQEVIKNLRAEEIVLEKTTFEQSYCDRVIAHRVKIDRLDKNPQNGLDFIREFDTVLEGIRLIFPEMEIDKLTRTACSNFGYQWHPDTLRKLSGNLKAGHQRTIEEIKKHIINKACTLIEYSLTPINEDSLLQILSADILYIEMTRMASFVEALEIMRRTEGKKRLNQPHEVKNANNMAFQEEMSRTNENSVKTQSIIPAITIQDYITDPKKSLEKLIDSVTFFDELPKHLAEQNKAVKRRVDLILGHTVEDCWDRMTAKH